VGAIPRVLMGARLCDYHRLLPKLTEDIVSPMILCCSLVLRFVCPPWRYACHLSFFSMKDSLSRMSLIGLGFSNSLVSSRRTSLINFSGISTTYFLNSRLGGDGSEASLAVPTKVLPSSPPLRNATLSFFVTRLSLGFFVEKLQNLCRILLLKRSMASITRFLTFWSVTTKIQ